MTDKQKPDLLFDILVTTIRNLKKTLSNFYDVIPEDVDRITRIGWNEE